METMTITRTVSTNSSITPFSEAFQQSISLLMASASGMRGAAKPGLLSLPDDILLLIISQIAVVDILSLRKVGTPHTHCNNRMAQTAELLKTSKRLCSVTKLRWVWSDAVKRHVIDKGLPVPKAVADLKTLSSKDLEIRVVHATRFHENWNSAAPKARQSVTFDAHRASDNLLEFEKPSVRQLFFLPGYNGELLVTLVGSTITCWDVPLDGSKAYIVAEWTHDRKIEQVVVNDEASKTGVVLALIGIVDPQ